MTHCVRHLYEYYGDANRELVPADEAYPLGIVLVGAILIDLSGRCCCLATPIERRWPIISSEGVQLAGEADDHEMAIVQQKIQVA